MPEGVWPEVEQGLAGAGVETSPGREACRVLRHLSYNLDSLKGAYIGVIKGDARS